MAAKPAADDLRDPYEVGNAALRHAMQIPTRGAPCSGVQEACPRYADGRMLAPQVLGVPRDASAEAIRAAYRKLALKYHPDKSHASEDPEQAAERFKEISTAHGILSDPEKRRKYDVGGFAAMEPSDLDMEIDISQLGVASTAFAAMFSRLGVTC